MTTAGPNFATAIDTLANDISLNPLQTKDPAMVSVPLMLEYEAVLTRPEHLAAAQISTADVEVLLDAIALVMEPIRISNLWRPIVPDPGDDLVLETAVNGRADVVVTFNLRDLKPAAERFRLEVIRPGDAVRRLENRS